MKYCVSIKDQYVADILCRLFYMSVYNVTNFLEINFALNIEISLIIKEPTVYRQ